jgi:hypothetical protein
MRIRVIGAALIAATFVLLAMGCASHSYPVTGAAAKGQKAQQQRLQSQFP